MSPTLLSRPTCKPAAAQPVDVGEQLRVEDVLSKEIGPQGVEVFRAQPQVLAQPLPVRLVGRAAVLDRVAPLAAENQRFCAAGCQAEALLPGGAPVLAARANEHAAEIEDDGLAVGGLVSRTLRARPGARACSPPRATDR